MPLALSGVSVIESGHSPATAFAGRLLRGMGASVARVGAAASEFRLDPTLDAFLNEGKGSAETIESHIHEAKIWLDSRPVPEILATRQSGRDLVHVAVTPFGLTGNWSQRAGSGFVAAALGAFLHLCGDSEREPLGNGGYVVEFQTGLFAVAGAIAGLLHLEATGTGLLVETSLLECVVAFQERADIAWSHQAVNWRRARRHEVAHPFTIFKTADGYITLAVGTPRHWSNLCLLIGRPDWADDPAIMLDRHANADLIDSALVPWLNAHPAGEVVRRCQELFIPCGPVLSPSQVLQDAHLAERQFFRQFSAPSGQMLSMPGWPYRTTSGWAVESQDGVGVG